VLGLPIFVASLEDTIVSKLEWAQAAGGSERQLEDVRALLQLGGERVDLQYVRHWVEALALETMWSKAAEDD
jgi:hypothetical protein